MKATLVLVPVPRQHFFADTFHVQMHTQHMHNICTIYAHTVTTALFISLLPSPSSPPSAPSSPPSAPPPSPPFQRNSQLETGMMLTSYYKLNTLPQTFLEFLFHRARGNPSTTFRLVDHMVRGRTLFGSGFTNAVNLSKCVLL